MEKKEIRSFGRIKSRTLKKHAKELLENLLPKFLIKDQKNLNPEKIFSNKEYICLEIGFGYGNFIAQQAILNPDTGFIGCEVYLNGIINLLRKIEKNNTENIKIYDKDARILLKNLKNNSLDKVFVLFPDPWPKRKHNKRRIINQNFLDLVYSRLKKNGVFIFVSDILDYTNWTIENIKNYKKFTPLFEKIENCYKEPEWWKKTKYQEKAIREGRKPIFLTFQKK